MKKRLLFIFIPIFILGIIFTSIQFSPLNISKNISESKSSEGYGAPDVSPGYFEKTTDFDYADNSTGQETSNFENTRKVIKSGYISIETEKFDNAFDNIMNKSIEIGGYIQTSRLSKNDVYINYSENYSTKESKKQTLRNGYLEARIPQESLNDFLDYVKNLGEVISLNTDTQDITDSYDITKSRLDALKLQESRILEIMKDAKNVSDLIQLENELNRIRTEIQISSNQLNGWNKQISLSTVVINIQEKISNDENLQIKDKNIWESSKKGFIKTTNKLIELVQYLIIFIISSIPILIIVSVILVVILRLVKFKNRKKE